MNYFAFGLSFAGFASVIGSLMNGTNLISINGLFYIVGVGVFGAVFS
jgi:hypothetical protein